MEAAVRRYVDGPGAAVRWDVQRAETPDRARSLRSTGATPDQLSFGVAFGDDVLLGGHDLATMRDIANSGADAVIAAQRVDQADIASFGVVDTHPDDPSRVTGIRQRPDPATVGEPLALVSRLILRPSVFALLVPTERARGEVDLGVAVGELARIADVRVHRITGHWVTVGEPRRYFDALRTYWQLQTEPTAHR